MTTMEVEEGGHAIGSSIDMVGGALDNSLVEVGF